MPIDMEPLFQQDVALTGITRAPTFRRDRKTILKSLSPIPHHVGERLSFLNGITLFRSEQYEIQILFLSGHAFGIPLSFLAKTWEPVD